MTATIRTIKHTESLDNVWEEGVYTEARLLGDPRTADLAPTLADLVARIEKVRAGQYAMWRAEIVAQARVDAVNVDLDGTTTTFGHRLLALLNGARSSARWVLYFKSAVSRFVKRSLASQLPDTRPWPDAIRGEPEAELHPFAEKFEQHITDADDALDAQGKAAAARAQHRVREINALIDDLNGVRLAILGRLLQRATKNGLTSEWAEGFFRHGQRHVTADPTDDAATVDEPAPAAAAPTK